MCAGPCCGVSASIESPWAVSAIPFGPLLVRPVDAYGNEVVRASLNPRISVRAAAAINVGGGAVGGSAARQAAGGEVALPQVGYELVPTSQQGGATPGGVGSRGGGGVALQLCLTGAPALVHMTIEDDDASLGAAVVEVQLTGHVHALHASVHSSGAVSGQLYGPIRVLAVDREGNTVGNATFAPTVRAERREGVAAEGTPDGSVSCVVEELQWRREVSGAPDVALLWLRITGDPGEIVLVVEDRGGEAAAVAAEVERNGSGAGRALCSTRVPLYMTGPPYFMRASWPSDEEVTVGEEVSHVAASPWPRPRQRVPGGAGGGPFTADALLARLHPSHSLTLCCACVCSRPPSSSASSTSTARPSPASTLTRRSTCKPPRPPKTLGPPLVPTALLPTPTPPLAPVVAPTSPAPTPAPTTPAPRPMVARLRRAAAR